MIKRVIYVADESEIDFDNIGVHFTDNLGYSHRGGGSNGGTKEKALKVTFLCENFQIFEDATEMSNEGCPSEKEVVLEPHQEISVEVRYQKKTPLGGYGRPYKIENKGVNTGDRMDLWVKKLI